MAMDPDLDQCVVRALRDMIALLGEKRDLSREDAYTLCSLAADLRVTQTVNVSKGIHCMIAKTRRCTGSSHLFTAFSTCCPTEVLTWTSAGLCRFCERFRWSGIPIDISRRI